MYIYVGRERGMGGGGGGERRGEVGVCGEKPADIILNPLPNEVNVVSVLQNV